MPSRGEHAGARQWRGQWPGGHPLGGEVAASGGGGTSPGAGAAGTLQGLTVRTRGWSPEPPAGSCRWPPSLGSGGHTWVRDQPPCSCVTTADGRHTSGTSHAALLGSYKHGIDPKPRTPRRRHLDTLRAHRRPVHGEVDKEALRGRFGHLGHLGMSAVQRIQGSSGEPTEQLLRKSDHKWHLQGDAGATGAREGSREACRAPCM